jgi:hypothetical protein
MITIPNLPLIELFRSCNPLVNASRSYKNQYRSGGMEVNRLLGCMLYTSLLEVYVEDINLRLDGVIRGKWRIIGLEGQGE